MTTQDHLLHRIVNEIKFLGRLELHRLNRLIFPILALQNCIRPYLAVVSILRINPRFVSLFLSSSLLSFRIFHSTRLSS